MLLSGLLMAAILVAPSLQQVTCDMSNRFESCTDGFCCARDDFQIHMIYCKKIGYEGEHCSTRPSSFDCPCHDGLYCKPNIAGHLSSLYGTCHRDKDINSTIAATTKTTSNSTTAATTTTSSNSTTAATTTTTSNSTTAATTKTTSNITAAATTTTTYNSTNAATTTTTSNSTTASTTTTTSNSTTAATITTTSKPGPACNMTDRFNTTCPPGFCCCQNDFLEDGIYCRRIGLQNDTCIVNSDDTSYCPCSAPFTCRPKFMTATFVSIYGKCIKPEHMPTVIG